MRKMYPFDDFIMQKTNLGDSQHRVAPINSFRPDDVDFQWYVFEIWSAHFYHIVNALLNQLIVAQWSHLTL